MLTERYAAALTRMKKLFDQEAGPGCCLMVRQIAELGAESVPLNRWRFPEDNLAYLKAKAEALKRAWQARSMLDDDSLPTLSPYYGIAEHSAFIGGPVAFETDTSYHQPILDAADGWRQLAPDPDNSWLNMFREGYAYYREQWSDDFFIKQRGAYGPMDLANMIRGNDLFYDFYDEPQAVHGLMDFCVAANRAYLDLQTGLTPDYSGGIICGFDIWMPEGSYGHLGEDASCLCSPEQYRQFGLERLRAQIEPYQAVLLHLHSLGRKNIPDFAGLDKVRVIQLSSDPNQPTSLQVYREYQAELHGKIVMLEVDQTDLAEAVEVLQDSRSVLFYQAKTLDEAQQAVNLVRSRFCD